MDKQIFHLSDSKIVIDEEKDFLKMPIKSASTYLVVFMMILTILATTLLIVSTQVTLPSKQLISHPNPMEKVSIRGKMN